MNEAWLEGRPHLRPLVAKIEALLESADRAHKRGRAGGESVDYAAFEEEIGRLAAEIESAAHQIALSSLDIDEPFVRVWGKVYRRVHRTERSYHAMSGSVRVERSLYRELGRRTGPTLDPVSLRAGAVDGHWLPKAAQAMAHLLAQGTSREAEATSRALLRLPYSRSSFERVGHEVGAQYLRRRERIEPRLIEAFELPERASSISVSVDRTSVPMEEPLPEDPRSRAPTEEEKLLLAELAAMPTREELDPRTQAALREQRRTEQEAKPKVARNYRMAFCATVTVHGPKGEALHTIRYGRMPPAPDSLEALTHRETDRLLERLRQDVLALRSKNVGLPVVLLADGAPELWSLFDRFLTEQRLGVKPLRLVDAWHVLEYVAAAARFAESRKRAWPGSFRRWRKVILKKEGGAAEVLVALRATGLASATDESGKRPVGDAIRYLENRPALLDYAGAKAAGLPIGSGPVEATCKSLFRLRMKRAGSRWKSATGDEVLQLRALQLSDRWEAAMERVLTPLRRPVHPISCQEAMAQAA